MGNEKTLQGLGLGHEELLLSLLWVFQQSSVVLNEAYFMGYKKFDDETTDWSKLIAYWLFSVSLLLCNS